MNRFLFCIAAAGLALGGFAVSGNELESTALRRGIAFYPGSEFPGAKGGLELKDGELRLDFDFTAGGAYVMARYPLSPKRYLKRVAFETRHEAPCGLSVRYIDSTQQTFQRGFPAAATTGDWRRIEFDPADTKGVGHWGGANDGVAHPPFSALEIMASNAAGFKKPGGPKGDLRVRALAFTTMSADEIAAIDRARARLSTVTGVITDFDRGEANALDPIPFRAEGGEYSAGRWNAVFGGNGQAKLIRSLPIYGEPVSFTLDVEAPAEAAGLEFQLHISCNWQHFTNTIGRLAVPPKGAKTIRQTLTVAAPPGPGWGYHGTPGDGKPVRPFMLRELIAAKGAAKVDRAELKLVSLTAATAVEEPILRVRPAPDSPRPPATLLVELRNLGGGTAAGSFAAELTDWEGRRLGGLETPAVAAVAGGWSRTEVRVPAVPDGVNAAFYRIRFRDAAGKDGGKPVTATWTRPLADHLPAVARPDLPWGMGLYIARHYLPGYDYSKMRRVFELGRDAGVKWIREGLEGGRRSDGTYNFGFADDCMALAREYGYSVYGIVGGDRHDRTIGTPEGRAAYCARLEATVRHFSAYVKDWEIWNEPNHPYFWPAPRADYPKLLGEAYAAVKRADPSAKVLGCSTAGLDYDFIRLAVTNGTPFDAVTTHPYRGSADETSFIADLGKVRDTAGGRENWLTEMGWSTWEKGIDEQGQAASLARVYMTAAATPGVKNICWYDFVNDGWNPYYCEENFGILRRDFAPKPGYRALAKVCRTFTEGRAELKSFPLGDSPKSGRAWLFRMGGRSAVWSDTERRVELRLPVTEAKITNLMNEPYVARRTPDGLVVTVDSRRPLFLAVEVEVLVAVNEGK